MKKHVLVVDDNQDIRSLISATLGNTFYTVATVSSGQEALEYLNTHDFPDLIILDLAMPIMSGLDLLQHIKDDPDTHHIEAIILSAQADDKTQDQALGMGARTVLTKPFSPLELLQELDKIFD